MDKNAGKIMMTIDKPRESTVAALGVSLRTVDRVYLESQATGGRFLKNLTTVRRRKPIKLTLSYV